MDAKVTQDRRIVVGVDGSDHSVDALRWGVKLAEALQCGVEAIIVWSYPAPMGVEAIAFPEPSLFEESARKTLDATLDTAFGAAQPAMITKRVVEGYPAGRLLDLSKGAEMLVLGSRGHGGFVGALLGSVSRRCSEHATCPVLIVHGE